MTPGIARILTCPHCGCEKEIMSLASGNTFGASYWSDNKCEAPMLPQVSYIQKCPECGRYFIISRQEIKYGHDYSFELGSLSYEETKEAVDYFMQEDISIDEKFQLLLYFIHSYNDHFHRASKIQEEESDKCLFKNYLNMILDLSDIWKDDCGSLLFKAELLRESERFDEATDILNSLDTIDKSLQGIATCIKDECVKHNPIVFQLLIQ